MFCNNKHGGTPVGARIHTPQTARQQEQRGSKRGATKGHDEMPCKCGGRAEASKEELEEEARQEQETRRRGGTCRQRR